MNESFFYFATRFDHIFIFNHAIHLMTKFDFLLWLRRRLPVCTSSRYILLLPSQWVHYGMMMVMIIFEYEPWRRILCTVHLDLCAQLIWKRNRHDEKMTQSVIVWRWSHPRPELSFYFRSAIIGDPNLYTTRCLADCTLNLTPGVRVHWLYWWSDGR